MKYCKKHLNTEMQTKFLGHQEIDGKTYQNFVLYCPYCQEDQYQLLIDTDGKQTIVDI